MAYPRKKYMPAAGAKLPKATYTLNLFKPSSRSCVKFIGK